ncbi:MAG: heavy metal-responsive transcriptional regulator [Terriglobia bacterium]
MRNGTFIGRVAQAAGVNVQTVRFYERVGLLPRPARTPSGYRLYPPETPDRLQFIKQAQALGFSLEEIKEILRLKYGGRSPCDCVRGLLEEKLRRVEQEMGALQRFRQELRRVLARSQRLPRLPHRASAICPIIQIQPLASGKKGRR